MAILKSTYQASNFSPNSHLYEITVSVDEELDATTINTVLPNNGDRMKTVDFLGFIPTGSSATVYTPLNMHVANFISESGVVNADTGYQTGSWKILASVSYK